jgi:hypothetical protein
MTMVRIMMSMCEVSMIASQICGSVVLPRKLKRAQGVPIMRREAEAHLSDGQFKD